MNAQGYRTVFVGDLADDIAECDTRPRFVPPEIPRQAESTEWADPDLDLFARLLDKLDAL